MPGTPTTSTAIARPGPLRRAAGAVGWVAIALAVGWAVLALHLTQSPAPTLRTVLAVALGCGLVLLPWLLRPRWKAAALLLVAFAAVVVWFRSHAASNDRQWLVPVYRTPTFEIDGDRMTVRNFRNFAWTRDAAGEQAFTPAWEERTYDLARLTTLDLFMSFWGPTLICHTFISFGFERDDGQRDYLCASIEFRPEVGERFAPVRSMFRNFELVYVVGDEKDIVRSRTSVRGEQVHLYRLGVDRAALRRLLDVYVAEANEVAARPQWYNAVMSSCGVNLITKTWAAGRPGRVGPWMLLNGRWDRVMYDRGLFRTTVPFAEIRRRSNVSPKGLAAGDEAGFSQLIRDDLISVPWDEGRSGAGDRP